MEDIVFLDVETPNGANDRICSIGLVRTDPNGTILDKDYTLLNPETEFSVINTRVNGIEAADVAGKPTFGEAWDKKLHYYFENSRIVAHNARFDLNVLDKTMASYHIPESLVIYSCTMQIARKIGLSNRKLDQLCNVYNIPLLHHHNSFDDAMACKGIFYSMIDTVPSENDWYWMKFQPKSDAKARYSSSPTIYRKVSDTTEHKNEILNSAKQYILDDEITLDEAKQMYDLLNSSPDISNDEMLSHLRDLLFNVLADGKISDEEEKELRDIFELTAFPILTHSSQRFNVNGKKFCLTGDFEFGSKNDVQKALEARGGKRVDKVSKNCSYVIVGSKGSNAYAFGNYGLKVKRAIELKEQGVDIEIIKESDLKL